MADFVTGRDVGGATTKRNLNTSNTVARVTTGIYSTCSLR